MFPDFLQQPVEQAAQQLLGCILERQIGDQTVKVRIVEVEAYDQDDEASHAFGGKTNRNQTMFGPSGHLYVYFTYGMHYCCNVVTGREGYGAGVLIRAAEPITGIKKLKQRRSITEKNITNGPAKLCRVLEIDFNFKGHDLSKPPLKLLVGELRSGEVIKSSPRIGISKAKQLKRRFYIQANPFVSR